MNNFDHAVEATETAMNSAGSATQENQRYMESLEAKTQQLKATFEDFANNTIESELVKSLLNLANNVLSALNTEVGQTVTQWTLLTGVLTGGITIFGQISTKLIYGITHFGSSLKTLSGIFTGATSGLSAIGSAALPIAGIISGIAVAVYGLYKAYKDSHPTFEETTEKLNNLEEELKNNKERLDELNNTPWQERTQDIRNETEELQVQNAELERQIQLQKELQYETATQELKEGGQYLKQGYGIDRVALINSPLTNEDFYRDITAAFDQDYLFSSIEDATEQIASILGIVAVEDESLKEKLSDLGIDVDNILKTSFTSVEAEGIEETLPYIKQQSEEIVQAINKDISAIGKISDETLEKIQSFSSVYGEQNELASLIVEVDKERNIITEEGTKKFVEYFSAISNAYNEEQEYATKLQKQREESIASSQKLQENLSQVVYQINNLNKADVLDNFSSAIQQSQSDIEELGSISSDSFNSLLTYIPDLTNEALTAQLGIDGLSGSLFTSSGELTTTGTKALEAAGGFSNFTKEVLEAQLALSRISYQKAQNTLTSLDEASRKASERVREAREQFGKESQQYSTAEKELFLIYDEKQEQRLIKNQAKLEEDMIQTILNSFDSIIIEGLSGGGGGGGSSSSKVVENILQPIKDELEKDEHKIFLLDKQDQENNAEQIIEIYKQMQGKIALSADVLRSKNYAEDSEEIRELQELWWKYQDEIDNVYAAIEQRAEEARQKIEEETQKQIESLTEQTNVYEQLFSYMTDQIDKEIEALEREKEAEEQLWDDKINALKEQNDEIERQIELEQLQDQLARARQSKFLVYKDGRFQYTENIDEVADAQKNLEDYEREESLNQKIENLEKLKQEAITSIDEQIEKWEDYKEEWSSVVDDYHYEQNRLMIEQELGIKLEGDHWKERLDNLQDFINDYKDLMEELVDLQKELNEEQNTALSKPDTITGGTNAGAIIGGIVGGSGGSLVGGAVGGIIGGAIGDALDKINSSSSNKKYSGTSTSGKGSYTIGSEKGQNFVNNAPAGSTMTGGDGSKWTKNPYGSTTISKGGNTWTVSGYASGTLSASGGLSLVGENGPELRWINPGDGILPANITKNLWGWGSMNPSEFMSKSSGTSVVIQNLNLPNVRDPQDFTNYLKNNFWRKTVQFQTK